MSFYWRRFSLLAPFLFWMSGYVFQSKLIEVGQMTLQANRADEALALELMRAIRADGEARVAPAGLELVSVTVDVTGQAVDEASDITYAAKVDRKTRTILFTGGSAISDGRAVMTATAVYRIAG